MPQLVIKGQAIADFIAEFTTPEKKRPEEAPTLSVTRIPKWGLYIDGFFNEGRSGVGLILVSPEGHRMHYALRFRVQSI